MGRSRYVQPFKRAARLAKVLVQMLEMGLQRAITYSLAAAAVVGLASCASPAQPSPAAATASMPTAVGDAYYLCTCAQCPALLGTRGNTTDEVWGRRHLRFCSDECWRSFQADPRGGLQRLDRVMIEDQSPFYPGATSIVSGAPLGEDAIEFIVGNRLFRVASPAEQAQVAADAGTYLQALDQAVIQAQRPTYGMQTKCPVQGDILESDVPCDIVVANRMIRVCCSRCIRVVRARPSQFLSMVDYANRAAAEAAKP